MGSIVRHTFVAVDRETKRHGLLVDVYDVAPTDSEPRDRAVDLTRRLIRRSVRVGLAITPYLTLVIKDPLLELMITPDAFTVRRISTELLLEHAGIGAPAAGTGFRWQIWRWLSMLGAQWRTLLPPEAIPLFVPDVVGHLLDVDLVEDD